MKIKFFFLALLASMTFSLSACEESETTELKSIVEIASSDANFSILVDALTQADLVTALQADGPFTVLAPTNAAFTQLLSDLGISGLDQVDNATLSKILLNHVITGEIRSTQLTTSYASTLATESTTGNPISLRINTEGGVSFNGDVNVTTADISASNGVIHVIDKVITIPTIVDIALDNPDFSILVAALTDSRLAANNYVSTLSGAGPFTVFAPTNAAFTTLLNENSWTGLEDIPTDVLEAVLNHHVISGVNAISSSLSDGQEVSTLNGEITVKIDSSVKVTDGSGIDSNVIATDVQAGNGVIHVVDRVLIPNM